MRKYKAALIGYYGFKNLGDELLLKASLEMLMRAGIKPSEILILSNSPSGTSEPKAISRWSVSNLIKAFINCERLIFGGGGIFQDSTSVKSCIWYWAVIKLAKILGVKVYAIGQSIGPLDTFTGKLFAANALKDLKILHVRDEPSLIYAKKFKLNNIIPGSDLALSLDLNFNANAIVKELEKDYPPLIPPLQGGVLILPCKGRCHEVTEGFKLSKCFYYNANAQDYILLNLRPHKELDKFIEQAKNILKNFNLKIIGAAFSPEDFDLLSELKSINIFKLYKFYDVCDLAELIKLFQGAEFAVGMRLHFNIIAFMLNIKCYALCYDPKVKAFSDFAELNNSQDVIIKAQSELDKICKILF